MVEIERPRMRDGLMCCFTGSRSLPSIRTRESESQKKVQNDDADVEVFDRIERETFKLELYHSDPFVDVRGLKR